MTYVGVSVLIHLSHFHDFASIPLSYLFFIISIWSILLTRYFILHYFSFACPPIHFHQLDYFCILIFVSLTVSVLHSFALSCIYLSLNSSTSKRVNTFLLPPLGCLMQTIITSNHMRLNEKKQRSLRFAPEGITWLLLRDVAEKNLSSSRDQVQLSVIHFYFVLPNELIQCFNEVTSKRTFQGLRA